MALSLKGRVKKVPGLVNYKDLFTRLNEPNKPFNKCSAQIQNKSIDDILDRASFTETGAGCRDIVAELHKDLTSSNG